MRALVLLISLMLASCAGSISPPSASPSSDAGPLDGGRSDAGAPDAGAVDAGPVVHLLLELHRGDGGAPSPIVARVAATDDAGASVAGLEILVESSGSAQLATEGDGGYVATVVPPFASGELTLSAHLAGHDGGVGQTVLVLPVVGGRWDLPRPVTGLVNTAGTEDSPTVSPDGQWLIVGTYSPVDLLCCLSGCGKWPAADGRSPACDTARGPISGPERPRMPGAERVLSPTRIDDAVPAVCAAYPDAGPLFVPNVDGGLSQIALPPVGVYGFHRQPDGSFGEPFLLDTGSDGFLNQPFSFSFLGTGAPGEKVGVIFGYHTIQAAPGKPHPWFTQLQLGQDNALARYNCPALGNDPQFIPGAITALPVSPAGHQAGNTSVALVGNSTYLLSDDESVEPAYPQFALGYPDGGYASWAPMALPEASADRRQPVYAAGRIFYYRDGDIVSAAWSGLSPGDPASFTDPTVELAIGGQTSGRTGEVIGLGQPTFARFSDGGTEMVFVYYRRSATGLDGQIGEVLLR